MTATVHQLPKIEVPEQPAPLPDRSSGIGWRLMFGLALATVFVVLIGGWAATAKLAGAVIAAGSVVDSNSRKVQHPSGGVVGEIHVKNGDTVEAGQVIVRLDETQTRAALGIIVTQLTELIGRKSRLAAERDGLDIILFPEGFEEQSVESRRVAVGERRFFNARREAMDSQVGQLKERITQLREEIIGLVTQRDAKQREVKLVAEELARVKDMYERSLMPITRYIQMQRDEARVAGELGVLISQIARTKAQISEIEIQMLGLDQTMRSEAQKELREIEAQIGELREREIAARDNLKRVDIRAPVAGTVHDLQIFTIGGVVRAAEPLMAIVPSDDELTIRARVAPADIDQITLGQDAFLRFSAFNQRTTPEIPGKVSSIGADLSRDEATGETYYKVGLTADPTEMKKLEGLQLVPGMPVEVFIQTTERTALSYISKPLTDHLERAFREE